MFLLKNFDLFAQTCRHAEKVNESSRIRKSNNFEVDDCSFEVKGVFKQEDFTDDLTTSHVELSFPTGRSESKCKTPEKCQNSLKPCTNYSIEFQLCSNLICSKSLHIDFKTNALEKEKIQFPIVVIILLGLYVIALIVFMSKPFIISFFKRDTRPEERISFS